MSGLFSLLGADEEAQQQQPDGGTLLSGARAREEALRRMRDPGARGFWALTLRCGAARGRWRAAARQTGRATRAQMRPAGPRTARGPAAAGSRAVRAHPGPL